MRYHIPFEVHHEGQERLGSNLLCHLVNLKIRKNAPKATSNRKNNHGKVFAIDFLFGNDVLELSGGPILPTRFEKEVSEATFRWAAIATFRWSKFFDRFKKWSKMFFAQFFYLFFKKGQNFFFGGQKNLDGQNLADHWSNVKRVSVGGGKGSNFDRGGSWTPCL